MRSTPILLDRLRHIRYDLQAVWDMDYLMQKGGGFTHILEKEITFELCRFLLWSGLKSESPDLTMGDAGRLMLEAGCLYGDHELKDVTLVCINELFESGWLFTPDNPKPATPDLTNVKTEPEQDRTVRDRILDLVRMAQVAGVTDTRVIWEMTPAEIEDMHKGIADYRDGEGVGKNYRMGTICSVIMDASMREKQGGGRFTWTDFAPQVKRPERIQTPEEMLAIIRATNAALGGAELG